MGTEILKIIDNIKKSAELVFKHCKKRGFRNTLIELGIMNNISLVKEDIEKVEQTNK